MEAFYVCMIFLGSILVLVSLFFSIMDKVNGKDFFTEFDRKKDEMFTLIAEAEEMIQELNKMSDYVISTISDKNEELMQLQHRASKIKGNTFDVSKVSTSNVAKADKSNVNKVNASNVAKAETSNVNKVNASNVAKADTLNVKKADVAKSSKVDGLGKESTVNASDDNTSNTTIIDKAKASKLDTEDSKVENAKTDNNVLYTQKEEAVKVGGVDAPNTSMMDTANTSIIPTQKVNTGTTYTAPLTNDSIEDRVEVSSEGLRKLQSMTPSHHDGTQAEQLNTYLQSSEQVNDFHQKAIFSQQKIDNIETSTYHTISSYNNGINVSDIDNTRLSVNDKRREALILIKKGLSNSEISEKLKIGKGEVALLRGLSK